jgi:kumamolisin
MSAVPEGYVRVEGSERLAAPAGVRTGPAPAGDRLLVTVRVRPRPGVPPRPDAAALAAMQAGARPYPTREAFDQQNGAAPADLEAVADFARSAGLEVVEQSAPRRTIVLAGTVETMSAAFGVSLGRYQDGPAAWRGREGFVHIPAALAPIVEGVFGLDDRPAARPRPGGEIAAGA